MLQATLAAVGAQTRVPDLVLVVDNASRDDTVESIASSPLVGRVLALPENLGYGAALAAGADAVSAEHDFLWLMDDDSQPRPDALASACAVLEQHADVDMVGLGQGGRFRLGVPRWTQRPGEEAVAPCHGEVPADVVLVDCALLRSSALAAVGNVRRDLFMMFEDADLCYRLGRHGSRIVWLPGDYVCRQHLGSTGGAPSWRQYYQARNVLRVAVERRSPLHVLGWLLRECRVLASGSFRDPAHRQRVRLRGRGATDALRGRMGWQGAPTR